MKKPGLISTDEAAAKILRAIKPPGTERVPLADAAGRILRETIRSDRDQPPYDRVTMDGFAMNSKDWKNGCREFPMIGIQRAGEQAKRMQKAGGCIEIMTGAVLPRGCDSIVPVEKAERIGDAVRIQELEPGRFIHRAGSDLKRRDVVLNSGVRLDGPAIGIAAAVGRASLLVSRVSKIVVVSTGDEIVPVPTRPYAHQVRASNAAAIAASLRLHGFHDLIALHIPDNELALERGLRDALKISDVLILTGGVSKGRFDFVPEVLAQLGVRKVFHGVKQQPGKPLWFGTTKHGQLVFGLPGNPVSVLVCLHRYVLAALGAAGGILQVDLGGRSGPDGLTLFRPVRLAQEKGRLAAELLPMKNSGDFFPLAQSDGFVEIPPDFVSGAVEFRPWR